MPASYFLRKIVAAKDAGGMSDKAYIMLMRRAQPNMMAFWQVQYEMHHQNDYITLKDVEETVHGCRRPVREVVKAGPP